MTTITSTVYCEYPMCPGHRTTREDPARCAVVLP